MCAPLSQVTQWDQGWPRLCHVWHVVPKVPLVLASSWQMGEKRESPEKANTLLNLDLALVRQMPLPISHWWKPVTYLIARSAGKWNLSCFSLNKPLCMEKEHLWWKADIVPVHKELKIIEPSTLIKWLRIRCNMWVAMRREMVFLCLQGTTSKMEYLLIRPNVFFQHRNGLLWERESS